MKNAPTDVGGYLNSCLTFFPRIAFYSVGSIMSL